MKYYLFITFVFFTFFVLIINLPSQTHNSSNHCNGTIPKLNENVINNFKLDGNKLNNFYNYSKIVKYSCELTEVSTKFDKLCKLLEPPAIFYGIEVCSTTECNYLYIIYNPIFKKRPNNPKIIKNKTECDNKWYKYEHNSIRYLVKANKPWCGQKFYRLKESSPFLREWVSYDYQVASQGTQRNAYINWQPMSFGFVFSSNSTRDLEYGVCSSPLYYGQIDCWKKHQSQCHEFIAIDSHYSTLTNISVAFELIRSISLHEILVLHHADVQFTPSFEHYFFRSFQYLREADPYWGMIGFGCAAAKGRQRQYYNYIEGGYHKFKPYVSEKFGYTNISQLNGACDEMALIFNRTTITQFDTNLPYFDSYGIHFVSTIWKFNHRYVYNILGALVHHKPLNCILGTCVWGKEGPRSSPRNSKYWMFNASLVYACRHLPSILSPIRGTMSRCTKKNS